MAHYELMCIYIYLEDWLRDSVDCIDSKPR